MPRGGSSAGGKNYPNRISMDAGARQTAWLFDGRRKVNLRASPPDGRRSGLRCRRAHDLAGQRAAAAPEHAAAKAEVGAADRESSSLSSICWASAQAASWRCGGRGERQCPPAGEPKASSEA